MGLHDGDRDLNNRVMGSIYLASFSGSLRVGCWNLLLYYCIPGTFMVQGLSDFFSRALCQNRIPCKSVTCHPVTSLIVSSVLCKRNKLSNRSLDRRLCRMCPIVQCALTSVHTI